MKERFREPTVRTRRCVDCAFHPESPENEFGSGGLAAEGGSIVWLLRDRIRAYKADVTPFFCHENLPTIPNDGWRAVAAIAKDTPLDQLEVCAGWAAEYRRIIGAEFDT